LIQRRGGFIQIKTAVVRQRAGQQNCCFSASVQLSMERRTSSDVQLRQRLARLLAHRAQLKRSPAPPACRA
jgi:non-canonical (house-cleaning) NTP pyrophosphatase